MIERNSNNATPIFPARIAIMTGTGGSRSPYDAMGLGAYNESRFAHGMAGLGQIPGVPPELMGTAIGAITDGIRSLFTNLFGSGNRDIHIPAQEEAYNAIAEIAHQIDNAASQGVLTATDLRNAIAGVGSIAASFTTIVEECIDEGRCHTQRARQGISEINTLATRLGNDWTAAIETYFPAGNGQPAPGGNGSGIPPAIPSAGTILPWIIGGGLLLMGRG